MLGGLAVSPESSEDLPTHQGTIFDTAELYQLPICLVNSQLKNYFKISPPQ
jgi:hypothetical protein